MHKLFATSSLCVSCLQYLSHALAGPSRMASTEGSDDLAERSDGRWSRPNSSKVPRTRTINYALRKRIGTGNTLF